ncbi:MAG: SMC family ATPase, partial [Thermoplasmata archaeon]
MLIHEIALENIKSFSEAVIYFKSGTNAICAPNGTGKTTVLEAIGYCLFDSLRLKKGQFLRYGAKSGKVSVVFTAQDGRIYRAVRGVGNNSDYFIYDPQTGVKLCTGKDDCVAWLSGNLSSAGRIPNLDFIFSSAVGVAQGTITSPFLLSDKARKAVFDPLFGTDEFEKAWNLLRSPEAYGERVVSEIEKSIAVLEEKVKDVPALEEDEKLLQERFKEKDVLLSSLKKSYEQVQKECEVLSLLQSRINSAVLEYEKQNAELKQVELRLENSMKRLDESVKAEEEAKRLEKDYLTHERAREEAKVLEAKRRKRDTLRKELNRMVLEAGSLWSGIISDKENIQQLKSRLGNISELEKAALKERELQDKLKTIELRLTSIAKLKERASRDKIQTERLKKEIEEMKSRIGEDISLNPEDEKRLKQEADKYKAAVIRIETEIEKTKDTLTVIEKGLCPSFEIRCPAMDTDLRPRYTAQLERQEKQLAVLKEKLSNAEGAMKVYEKLRQDYIKQQTLKATLSEKEKILKNLIEEIQQAEKEIQESLNLTEEKKNIQNELEKLGKPSEKLQESLLVQKNIVNLEKGVEKKMTGLFGPADSRTKNASADTSSFTPSAPSPASLSILTDSSLDTIRDKERRQDLTFLFQLPYAAGSLVDRILICDEELRNYLRLEEEIDKNNAVLAETLAAHQGFLQAKALSTRRKELETEIDTLNRMRDSCLRKLKEISEVVESLKREFKPEEFEKKVKQKENLLQ